MKVEFTVLGTPMGKGRPVFSRYAGGVHTRTPEKTAVYENLVRMEYERQCDAAFPTYEALKVDVFAYYAIPKSVSKKMRQAMLDGIIRPTKAPDWDNIGKIICDSLNGLAYHDDSQVVAGTVQKWYSEQPRVHIIIQTIGGSS